MKGVIIMVYNIKKWFRNLLSSIALSLLALFYKDINRIPLKSKVKVLSSFKLMQYRNKVGKVIDRQGGYYQIKFHKEPSIWISRKNLAVKF